MAVKSEVMTSLGDREATGNSPGVEESVAPVNGLPYSEIVGVVSAVTCLATLVGCLCVVWRCRQSRRNNNEGQGRGQDKAPSPTSITESSSSPVAVCSQQDLCISQSNPDFNRTSYGSVFADKSLSAAGGRCRHTVVKQRTLPVFSSRHLWFNRLPFHRYLNTRQHRYLNSHPPPTQLPPAPSRNNDDDMTSLYHPDDDLKHQGNDERHTHLPQQQHDKQLHLLHSHLQPEDRLHQKRPAVITSAQGVDSVTLHAGLVQPQQRQQPEGSVWSTERGYEDVGGLASLNRSGVDCSQHGSVAASEAVHSTSSHGVLHVALSYENGALFVRVIRIDGLPARNLCESSNPYVKVNMLPDKAERYQTKLQRKTLNPIYEERFKFSVPSPDGIQWSLLQFSIYDFDKFSRHDLVGTAVMQPRLHSYDITIERLYALEISGKQQNQIDLGELLLSLRYLPTAGRLTVAILKATNLKATNANGKSDPFVKVTLTCQGQRITKRKTSVKNSTCFPVYNETMTFDVPHENISDVSLEVKVMHQDSCSGSELMGACAVGTRFSGTGRDHWLKTLDLPRKSVAQWYQLKENVPPMTSS